MEDERLVERVEQLHRAVCDLLFPPRCPVCDGILRAEERKSLACRECRGKLMYVREPRCMKCGASLRGEEEEYCRLCAKHRHQYDRGLALYEYSAVRTAIYRFKYSGRKEYAEFFGREMALRFGSRLKEWGVQALVPIPLYAAKERKRGYNQAAELAEVCGHVLNMPVAKKLVRRVRSTRPMKLLSAKERQINLKNAFLITQDVVKLEAVALVDDIYTTGSTMDAVAAVLKASGVKRVYCISLAVGSGI